MPADAIGTANHRLQAFCLWVDWEAVEYAFGLDLAGLRHLGLVGGVLREQEMIALASSVGRQSSAKMSQENVVISYL